MTDLYEVSTQLNCDVSEVSQEHRLAVVEARELLLGQFALAEAPITGRRVGCILEVEGGELFAGHNRETEDPIGFFHAEANTLDIVRAAVGDVAISGIYMGGSDPRLTGQQLKNITPCSDCYGLLEPHLTPDAALVLFEPNTLNEATVFSPGDYRPAYGRWPSSEVTAQDRDEIIQQLTEKTPLTEIDREVVADLRLLGLATGIEFYLTGSSSGRGWMSTAIHNRLGSDYGDMDIIAVTDRYDKDQLSELVAAVVRGQYGNIVAERTETDYWVVCGDRKGTQRHVIYDSYFMGEKKVMDFSWAASLKAGMLRDDYFANNCYHKIS